jgi:hypothetical protein
VPIGDRQLKALGHRIEILGSQSPPQQTITRRYDGREHLGARITTPGLLISNSDKLNPRPPERNRPVPERRRLIEPKPFDRRQPVVGLPIRSAGAEVRNAHHQVINEMHARIIAEPAPLM